jgi:MFS family permease
VRSPFENLPREVGVLAAVAAAVAVGFGVVAPAIPLFAESFGVGKTAVGAVVSAFALMRFVSALGGGRLVDQFGERVILSTGIGIVAVSTGLAGLSQNYTQLLLLRGIGGVGSAMFTVSATALLLRVVVGSSRGRATGLFQAGFLIGGVLGPVFGGYLTDYSLRLPFYVYAVSLIGAGSIGAVFLKASTQRADLVTPSGQLGDEALGAEGPAAEGPAAEGIVSPSEAAKPETSTTLGEAWAHPGYRAAIAVNFATGWALFGIRFSLIPLFVTESMGLRPVWTGYGFLCSAGAQAVALLYAGQFVDRVGRRPGMIVGTSIAGFALLLLAFSAELPVFLVSMTATGIGAAFIGTAPGAVVGDIMRGRSGRVVAVFQMASDAGSISGPLVAGALTDTISYGAAFAACSVVLFLATGLSLRMPETLVKE